MPVSRTLMTHNEEIESCSIRNPEMSSPSGRKCSLAIKCDLVSGLIEADRDSPRCIALWDRDEVVRFIHEEI